MCVLAVPLYYVCTYYVQCKTTCTWVYCTYYKLQARATLIQVCIVQSFSAATGPLLVLALFLLFLLPRSHVHVHLARRDDCINHVLFFQAPHH